MVNQYFGATQLLPGATYLSSRAILHIDEGYSYNIGGITTEYISIGDFEVTDLNHGGAFRQSLQLSAHGLSKRPIYMNTYFTKQFQSALTYLEEFADESTFNTHWSPLDVNNTTIIGATNNTLRGLSVNIGSYYYTTQEFDSFRAVLKATTSNFPSSELGIDFHSDLGVSYYYYFIHNGGNLSLYRQNGLGQTLLASQALALTNNTYYWFMIEQYNQSIKCYLSTDGYNFTGYFGWDISGDPPNLRNGFVGIHQYSGGVADFTVQSFEVVEWGSIFTKEDVIKGAYAMSNVYGVSIANEIAGVSQFNIANVGGCWIYGTSSNVFASSATLGDSWNTLITSGMTFADFVAEVEYRGTSDANGGILVGTGLSTFGTPANWYTHWVKPGGGNVANGVAQFYGLSKYYYLHKGDNWNYKKDIWYRLKLIKQGSNLIWEVNDQIVGSVSGSSLEGGGTQVYIGLAAYRRGTGVTAEFRNFRISQLDDVIDNVGLEPESPVQSLIDRVLPDGFAITNKASNVEIYQIGDGRGTHDVGLSDYIDSSQQDLSNITSEKAVVTKIGDNMTIVGGKNDRVQRQVDSSRIAVISDEISDSQVTSDRIAHTKLAYDNRNIQPINLSIANRPSLEQYDYMNFVDLYLGVSKQFLIFDMNKSFNSSNGEFRISLQLNSYEP